MVVCNTLQKSVLTEYCTQEFISNSMCIRFLQQYQLYHLTKYFSAYHNHCVSFILWQLRYKVNIDLLPQLIRYGQWSLQSSYLLGVKFEMLTRFAIPAILLYIVSYPWPVELLQDYLLHLCLVKITTPVIVFS